MQLSASVWDGLIASLPNPHILQTWEWAEVKARNGWQPYYYVWIEHGDQLSLYQLHEGIDLPDGKPAAAALVLLRTASMAGLTLRVGYLPKGPLVNWQNERLRKRVLSDLAGIARGLKAIFIKIDPDVVLGYGIPGEVSSQECDLGKSIETELSRAGWQRSGEQVQFRNTMVIDLTCSEEEILANMKQKTRYNVHLAERKGVVIRVGAEHDIPTLYQMYAETSIRDGFVIREFDYYQTTWEKFIRAGIATPLLAEANAEIVAGLILFIYASRAWYLFGMSRERYREYMPNYLLQWAAIRHAKAAGCTIYDLWGAPDRFEESDPMWGVYRFKDGLGAKVVRTTGAWDLPIKPLLFRGYTQALPRILELMRRRGKMQTRREAGI